MISFEFLKLYSNHLYANKKTLCVKLLRGWYFYDVLLFYLQTLLIKSFILFTELQGGPKIAANFFLQFLLHLLNLQNFLIHKEKPWIRKLCLLDLLQNTEKYMKK